MAISGVELFILLIIHGKYFQVGDRIGIFAVFGEDRGSVSKKSSWGPLFDVEDPRSRAAKSKGKFLDVNQALELARLDIQYLDWRARQDVLRIMLLHEKVCHLLRSLPLLTS